MCRFLMCKPLRHFPGDRLVTRLPGATFPADWLAAHQHSCLPVGSQGREAGKLALVFCK